jgi:G3E family GTPase
VLRIKGLLHVRDLPAPVVIHGVQHVIHPPAHLERWTDADRRSRVVFIVRDMNPATIEASLAAFNRRAAGAVPGGEAEELLRCALESS